EGHGGGGSRPVRRFVPRYAQQLPALGLVPDFHFSGQERSRRTNSPAEGGELPAVRAESQSPHGGGVRGPANQLASVGRVPDLDLARSAHAPVRGGQPPAVRTECHARYEVLVPAQAKELLSSRHVPDLDLPRLAILAASGREQLAVRTECHAADGGGVAG